MAAVRELWLSGGLVMPWLALCSLVMWYALGYRLLLLRRGDRRSLHELVMARRDLPPREPRGVVDEAVALAVARARAHHHTPQAVLQECLAGPRAALDEGRVLVHTVVALAPLLGLLGTVTGMIETFRSLAEMALFTQGGGIAGGIAEALLTTQMGLGVAVPGVIVGRLLDQRQVRLAEELDQLTELLHATPLSEVRPRRVP